MNTPSEFAAYFWEAIESSDRYGRIHLEWCDQVANKTNANGDASCAYGQAIRTKATNDGKFSFQGVVFARPHTEAVLIRGEQGLPEHAVARRTRRTAKWKSSTSISQGPFRVKVAWELARGARSSSREACPRRQRPRTEGGATDAVREAGLQTGAGYFLSRFRID